MFPWVKLGLYVALAGGGTLVGWTVRDWKRDAEVLAQVQRASAKLDESRRVIDRAATAYEEEKEDGRTESLVRQHTIREVYRDRPVAVDCAAPDDVSRVLIGSVTAANSNATGKSSSEVSEASPTPDTPD